MGSDFKPLILIRILHSIQLRFLPKGKSSEGNRMSQYFTLFKRLLCLLVTVSSISGCVHNNPNPEVFVNSVGLNMNNTKPLFFRETSSKELFEQRIYRQKIVEACKQEGVRKGFKIISSEKQCSDCYVITVSGDVKYQNSESYMPAYTSPVTTNCQRYGTSTNCISLGGNTTGGYYYNSSYYAKIAIFLIYTFDLKTKKFEEVRNLGAVVSSGNGEFSDKTAEHLCRGFFAGFDKDVSESFELPPRDR